MKINIGEKYAFIYDSKGNQIQYFEIFEGKDEKRRVIELCFEDRKGEKFVKENDQKSIEMTVSWFGRKTKYNYVQFIMPNKTDYLRRGYAVLIKA